MENTERTAYDIAYLNDEIDLHALLPARRHGIRRYPAQVDGGELCHAAVEILHSLRRNKREDTRRRAYAAVFPAERNIIQDRLRKAL